jgi:hypothetical protein
MKALIESFRVVLAPLILAAVLLLSIAGASAASPGRSDEVVGRVAGYSLVLAASAHLTAASVDQCAGGACAFGCTSCCAHAGSGCCAFSTIVADAPGLSGDVAARQGPGFSASPELRGVDPQADQHPPRRTV